MSIVRRMSVTESTFSRESFPKELHVILGITDRAQEIARPADINAHQPFLPLEPDCIAFRFKTHRPEASKT